VIGWPVLYQRVSVAVKNNAPRRWHLLQTNAIILRLVAVFGPLQDLQIPHPEDIDSQHHQHDCQEEVVLSLEDRRIGRFPVQKLQVVVLLASFQQRQSHVAPRSPSTLLIACSP